MKKIMYEQEIWGIGRNGIFKSSGLDISYGYDGELILQPLNIQGNFINAIINIPKDSIKEVIDVLQHESDRINGKLYRVKIGESTTLHQDALKDGYLAFCGEIQEYRLREARRKAKAFGGEVERVC